MQLPQLYYNIVHSVIPLLRKTFDCRAAVSLKVRELRTGGFNAGGVGTGCSMGIDSFACIQEHFFNAQSVPSSYRLTHLCYFNVGAFGADDPEAAERSFKSGLDETRRFAAEVSLPVVPLTSNIASFYRGQEYALYAIETNAAAILALQKLFKRYLFASAYPIEELAVDPQAEHFVDLLLPLLSTEDVFLSVAESSMPRSEKTRLIADNPFAQRYLSVCWKEILSNNRNQYSGVDDLWLANKDGARNCTRCDKCLRTCVTLDILGKLDKFAGIFDLTYYRKVKNNYLAKVIAGKDGSWFYRDIYGLAQREGWDIPKRAKTLARLIRQGAIENVV